MFPVDPCTGAGPLFPHGMANAVVVINATAINAKAATMIIFHVFI